MTHMTMNAKKKLVFEMVVNRHSRHCRHKRHDRH